MKVCVVSPLFCLRCFFVGEGGVDRGSILPFSYVGQKINHCFAVFILPCSYYGGCEIEVSVVSLSFCFQVLLLLRGGGQGLGHVIVWIFALFFGGNDDGWRRPPILVWCDSSLGLSLRAVLPIFLRCYCGGGQLSFVYLFRLPFSSVGGR